MPAKGVVIGSAVPLEEVRYVDDGRPRNETITRKPFPGSRKVYAGGKDPSIRVPIRAIALTDGETHVVYDTSGPYTDPDAAIDVRTGIAPLRQAWIEARNDTVVLDKTISLYPSARRCALAKPGSAVTQMHYARRGTITPEMEFVAIRENCDAGVRARRSRARPRDHSREHQPSRKSSR